MSGALHILAITGDFDDQYGPRFTATYSADGETLRQTTFARQGRHDEFAVVGGEDLAESDWRFGEIVDLIIGEAEDYSQAELHEANLRRASEWLAFREGDAGEDVDAMLPRTVEIPALTMVEMADLYWQERALAGGGR
jgi:hypothetical protein